MQRWFRLIRSYILTSGFWDIQSSGTQASFTNSRHGNLNFRRVICFRFRSGFCFRSDFYIRDSGGTTASPCAWPEDHGSGRFYVTYLARTCHYGCRVSLPGRRLWSRLAWQVAATYVIWRCGFRSFFARKTLLTRLGIWRKLLLESTAKLRLLRQAKYDAYSTSRRGKIGQKWE